jgi:hypothetical protein
MTTAELIARIEADTNRFIASIDDRLARLEPVVTRCVVTRWRARREQIANERRQPR